jgi:DNA-binding NarL/FixJ family response regulator
MTNPHRPRLVLVDNRTAVRGAIRHFIETTTPYKVCDVVDDGVSAIHKAVEAGCDLVLLNLDMPLLVTAALLRSTLPHVKIVGFNASVVDLGNQASPPATGFDVVFDAVLTKQDELSKLAETLKALMPEPPRE